MVVPRVFDCCFVRDEWDMLEARMRLLGNVVKGFVVVEATKTFDGAAKTPGFDKERFSVYPVEYVLVEDLPDPKKGGHGGQGLRWAPENAQRNAIVRGLKKAAPNDVVMISDVDEMPNPDKILGAANIVTIHSALSFQQRHHVYGWHRVKRQPWHGTVMTTAKLACLHTPQWFRDRRDLFHRVRDGGWHLSWWGKQKDVLHKLKTHPHDEEPEDMKANLAKRFTKGEDPHGRTSEAEKLVEWPHGAPTHFQALAKLPSSRLVRQERNKAKMPVITEACNDSDSDEDVI